MAELVMFACRWVVLMTLVWKVLDLQGRIEMLERKLGAEQQKARS